MSQNNDLIFKKQDDFDDSDESVISENSSDGENSENIKSSDNLLSQIDRKIILKFMKEGKNTKTYIIGLEGYLKDDEQLIFIKEIQKKLGTSLLKKITEDKKPIYGLGGDHINSVFDFLVKKNIAKPSEIKK